jgi:formylmethanofuran dehydrogenase subunit E
MGIDFEKEKDTIPDTPTAKVKFCQKPADSESVECFYCLSKIEEDSFSLNNKRVCAPCFNKLL